MGCLVFVGVRPMIREFRIFNLPVLFSDRELLDLLRPLIVTKNPPRIADETFRENVSQVCLRVAGITGEQLGLSLNSSTELHSYDLLVAAFALRECYKKDSVREQELAQQLFVDALLTATYGLAVLCRTLMQDAWFLENVNTDRVNWYLGLLPLHRITGNSTFSVEQLLEDRLLHPGMKQEEKASLLRDLFSPETIARMKDLFIELGVSEYILNCDRGAGSPMETVRQCISSIENGSFTLA